MCAELGIKLALKGDDNDRLQVDAPKGALTASIRETLTAHKTEIVAALQSKSRTSQPQILSRAPDETLTRTPASTTSNSPEATPLILEQPLTNLPGQPGRTELEARLRTDDEARWQAEAAAGARAAEEARKRVEVETFIRAEQEAKRKVEEEGQGPAEQRRAEEARLRLEQETLKQLAAELARRRSELEEARHRTGVEARLLVEAEELARAEQESLQQEVERQRIEAEARRLAEERQLEDARRRAVEERQQAAERARVLAAQEEQRLAGLESVKTQAEEVARRMAEQEQRITAEIFALINAEEEQRLRIEAEIKRRNELEARLEEQAAKAEAEAHRTAEGIRLKAEEQARRRTEAEARLQEEEARLQAEEEARIKAEEEAQRLAEEFRLRAEAESLRRAVVETRMKEEEARLQSELEARERAEVEAQLLAEQSRLYAEEVTRRRRAEAETRLIEAEARLQAEYEAIARAEEEAQRLADETRQKAEQEAIRLAEVKAQLREEEARLQSAQEARAKAEVEALGIAKESERFETEARLRAAAEARPKVDQERLIPQEADLAEAFAAPFRNEASGPDYSSPELSSLESDSDQLHENAEAVLLPVEEERMIEEKSYNSTNNEEPARAIEGVFSEEGIVSAEDDGGIPSDVLARLKSPDANVREAALTEVVRVGGDDAFLCITRAFDDQSVEVCNAAARALFDLHADRAATFTRALRESTPERRRKIGQALAASGIAKDAIGNLNGENREKTYDAFSLLFLMAKAGEVQPLMQAIEDYPNVEVQIAVVKLLALSGQPDIVPAFRRLAVRASLPSEVRAAVMEAIYQISSQARDSAPSAA
jgi:hypothetical protein